MAYTCIAILLLCMSIGLCCRAEVTVTGSVTERATGEPVGGAMLTVRDASDRALAFTASAADGSFSLRYEPADSLWLVAVSMGYAPLRQLLSGSDERVEIVLDEGAIKLREVSVKADRVRGDGDTVIYHVGGFAREQDRTIGDVMKRMPGIAVSDAGRIQYQGRDISKFYIEGEDLLGGRYGIATNGVSYHDVGAVEILENHQAMEVLRGLSYSDDVAVNLKLKDKSKATVAARGTAGGGYSPQPRGALWMADALAMLAASRYQFITTLKSNNTGADILSELADFTAGEREEQLKSYFTVAAPATPGLKLKRSYFNRSTALSTNHLWKVKGVADMRLRLDGWTNRLTAAGEALNTYYLESGDRIIAERRDSRSKSDGLTAALDIEINRPSFYLSNTLAGSFGRHDMRLDMTGSVDNVQHAHLPDMDVSNTLKLVRRSGNRLLTLESFNSWQMLPQRLMVQQADATYGQTVRQQAFVTDQKTSFGLILGPVRVSMYAGLGGLLRSVKARSPYEYPVPDASGTLSTDYMRVYVSPECEWQAGTVNVRLRVPLSYYLYHFTRGLPSRQRIYPSPSAVISWSVTPRLNLSLTASVRNQPMPMHDLHRFVTLTDYRTMARGNDDFYSSASQSLSLRGTYRQQRKGLFANGMLLHVWRSTPWRRTREFFDGDYMMMTGFQRVNGRSNLTSAMADVSKLLDFMNGGVSLGASWLRSVSEMLSEGTAMRNRSLTYSLSPGINGAVARIMNWSYRYTVECSRLHAGSLALPALTSQTHTLALTLTPLRRVKAGIDGEYYHTAIAPGRYKDMMMMDAHVSVSLGARIDLECRVNNLLDRRSYAYTTYGTLSSYACESRLRGRELLVSVTLHK